MDGPTHFPVPGSYFGYIRLSGYLSWGTHFHWSAVEVSIEATNKSTVFLYISLSVGVSDVSWTSVSRLR